MIKRTRLIALIAIITVWICVPVFSAETDFQYEFGKNNTPSEKKTHRFDLLSAFSYYPAKAERVNFQKDTLAPAAPAEYEKSHSFNMNLQMGMKLFKDWQAYIDFGIKEKNVQKAIDLMAKFGPQYFTVQLDYTLHNGKIHLWKDTPFGSAALEAIQDRPADSLVDYNQTWMSVALMLTPKYVNRISRIFEEQSTYLGIFYSSATVPFLITSEVMEITEIKDGKTSTSIVPANGAAAEFDPEIPIWTVGLRIGFGWDHNTNYRLLSHPTIDLFITCVVDVGFGKSEPDAELVKRMRSLNENFKNNFSSTYLGGKLNIGLYREFPILKDKIILLGVGYEMGTQKYFLESDYYLPMNVGVNQGPYAQLVLRF